MFGNIYKNRRVLVTGSSGFKGSWLCAWLQQLGAEVCGVSLPMPGNLVHSELLKTPMQNCDCDIRSQQELMQIFSSFAPEAVFHLAAQPIVRLSYQCPTGTFETNVIGTVNVLECCRNTSSVRAAVVISSDKCYENRETLEPYCETDPMGGYDPYSASKGCTELTVSCWQRSFFNPAAYGSKHHTLLASARAGNVIGGGDWAVDRLVPDIMRSAADNTCTLLRNPDAVRPWQHVLEPLSGYLLLGQRLLAGDTGSASGWNFGPDAKNIITVRDAATMLSRFWDEIKFDFSPPAEMPHEAGLLLLDCRKAAEKLCWHGVLTPEETFEMTAGWYREFYRRHRLLTMQQIDEYITKAAERGLTWTK